MENLVHIWFALFGVKLNEDDHRNCKQTGVKGEERESRHLGRMELKLKHAGIVNYISSRGEERVRVSESCNLLLSSVGKSCHCVSYTDSFLLLIQYKLLGKFFIKSTGLRLNCWPVEKCGRGGGSNSKKYVSIQSRRVRAERLMSEELHNLCTWRG